MASIISSDDRKVLVEDFNQTDEPSFLGFCLPHLFESAAANYPHNIAVIADETETTFRTLNERANQLARVLSEDGVQHGDLVGVSVNRSLDLVVAILAVTKLGAAYVPIDAKFPTERIAHMISDAAPRCLLIKDCTRAALSKWTALCLNLDELKVRTDVADTSNLQQSKQVCKGDLAYVIYTSGSTGKPKGVEASQEALCNLLLSYTVRPGIDTDDRVLAVASLSFDISILDHLLPIISGAAVVIAKENEQRDPSKLISMMKRYNVTMVQATPSFWQMLLDGGWDGTPRLRRILTAGEPISIPLRNRLVGYIDEVWNGYGPTEATVSTCVGRICEEDDDITIGTPTSNFQVYVLNPADLSVVPIGTIGELYVGGVGVNMGYHNKPELTRDKFVDNPFHKGRLYRTGDLARFMSPSKLSIVGRSDHQVKVRGYRIELDDVSAAIMEHAEVHAAVTVCKNDQLIAYYLRTASSNHEVNVGSTNDNVDDTASCDDVSESEMGASTSDTNSTSSAYSGSFMSNSSIVTSVDGDEVESRKEVQRRRGDGTDHTLDLRSWLSSRRPAYMIPAFFIEMSSFPMTLNGKIDRNALPEPMMPSDKGAKTTCPPQTELQQRILDIWADVLGHNAIGIKDNFFQIGGNSIRVPRVKKRLEAFLGRSVPITKLFEHFTIKEVATYLEGQLSPGTDTKSLATPPSEGQVEGATDRTIAFEDIAIVSMACRLPGNVSTPKELWRMLENGEDGIIDVPQDRWSAKDIYDPDPEAAGKSYCVRGGFLKEGIQGFDASFFGITPREARSIDPQQRVILETCWEAFERAGYTMQQVQGSNTGMYMGMANATAYNRSTSLTDLDGYGVTGTASACLSGRASYFLGLEGPSMTIDTACSSSLVTTHLACTALRLGECDMAVAGGITLMPSAGLHVEFSQQRGLSRNGACHAFSADSEGVGFSEGATIIILKRLSDAQKAGDRIEAVIKGSAINHGGKRSASLTTPSSVSQELLIRNALRVAGLKPDDIDYVEAHGTATKLGDPIEGSALAAVFGDRDSSQEPLRLGSGKSNHGHTQAAAGIAGIMKVVLAMQNGILPRNLHVSEPTSMIDWENSNMELVLRNESWTKAVNKPRRAGVSSFGLAGTNAHVILEEAPAPLFPDSGLKNLANVGSMSFLISGQTDQAVQEQAERLYKYILENSHDLSQRHLRSLAYSLATTRTHFRRRAIIMANDEVELLQKLQDVARSPEDRHFASAGAAIYSQTTAPEPKVAMLFTGQGSQVLGMGQKLSATHPVFRDTLEDISSHFKELDFPLLDVMWATSSDQAMQLLGSTAYAQPAIFAFEVALARLYQSWGVKPDIVLGHSVGEIAAAHIAGIFDLTNACRLVAERGRMMQAASSEQRGSMVSLESSAAEAAVAISDLGLDGQVDIAAYNTPMQTVVSGDADATGKVAAHFRGLSRKVKRLDVSSAFHSFHMDAMLPEFGAFLETIHYNASTTKLVSSLTGKLAAPGQLQQPEYWVEQVRRGVRFKDSVQTLFSEHHVNVFVEMGLQPILSGMAAACIPEIHNDADDLPAFLPYVASGKKDERDIVYATLAQLHLLNLEIHWSAYYKPFGCKRVELPTYAFQRERYEVPKFAAETVDSALKTASATMKDPLNDSFIVEWRDVETSEKLEIANGSSWALLCPPGKTLWTKRVELALSNTGLQFTAIEQLEEIKGQRGIICLWDNNDVSENDIPRRALGFSTIALTQLQTAARSGFVMPIVWVTHGAVGADFQKTKHSEISNESPHHQDSHLEGSPLWGIMRTARNEHPDLRLRIIDVSDDDTETMKALSRTLQISEEPEIAIRQGSVLVPRLQRAEGLVSQSSSNGRLLRQDGAVLITGGLGAIGKHSARWLVRSHGIRDLVLLSRKGMESYGAQDIIDELGQLGATIDVVTCDVGSFESLESVVKDIVSKNRPLRGIIHSAGVTDDGVLSTLTPESLESVYRPKLDGAWYLHLLTRDMDLDMFAMCSSLGGILGWPGLGNYSAANSFLDALAHHRCTQGLPATSVAFGPWAGEGMAVALSGQSNLAHMAKFGLQPLEAREGLALIEHAIRAKRPLTIGACLDFVRLRTYLRDEMDGGSPFYSALIEESGSESNGVSAEKIRSEGTRSLRDALRVSPKDKQASIMTGHVRETAAKCLGFSSAEQVDVNIPLKELGFDSLTTVMVRNNLAKLTGVKTVSASSIMSYPTLAALSELLLSKVLAQESEDMPAVAKDIRVGDTDIDMSAASKGLLDQSFSFNVVPNSERPTSVFITGATGFVGAFILQQLLEQNITAHCLVRGEDSDHGKQRLVDTLQSYSLWKPEYESLLKAVIGDASKPYFGLAEDVFADLSSAVDTICHSSALVDWMKPLNDYIGPNVISMHECLRLASQGRGKAVHVVSTIATLPMHLGYDVSESDVEYGYMKSKYMAERMVAAARFRGAKASIYRVPFVTASAQTGHFRRDQGDFLHNLIAGSLEMGAFPSFPGADLSVVQPVDYLASTITNVMVSDCSRIGMDFDFSTKHAESADTFFRLMGRNKGLLPFKEWKDMASKHATQNPKSPLRRVKAVIDGLVDETAASEMLKGLPCGSHVFGGEIYPAPRVDEELIERYRKRILGLMDT